MDVYNLVLERYAIWKPLAPADPCMDLSVSITGQCLVRAFSASIPY